MSPLVQRLGEAVHTLISDGPVKLRLAVAFSGYLSEVTESEFPAGLRRDFAELQSALTRVTPVGSESRVRASVQKMSSEEATSHAATIVKLYVELLNSMDRAEPLKVMPPPRKPPRFLTG